METQTKANVEHALKWGLILGMINIVVYLLVYLIAKDLIVNMWFGLSLLVANIFLLILPVTSKRKELGGLISFNDAFIICMLVFTGSALLQSIFNYVLYNLIDGGLSEFIKQKTIENTVSMMEKFGAPQDSIDKTLNDLQNQDFSQSPARIGKQFLVMIIMGGIISLILAAILKKTPKVTDFE